MNDYGLFQGIQTLIQEDEFLSPRIHSLVTEPRPGMALPYSVLHIRQVEADIPSAPQYLLVTCELELFSAYHGDQEIQQLMSRLDYRLNGGTLQIHIKALNAQGVAVAKQLEHSISHSPQGGRIGKLIYQFKIRRI